MTSTAESLFDATDDTEAPRSRIFFLTNRYNLLEILSSGLIAPLSGYGKYYSDLLELSPGRVPLVADPLPSTAIRRMEDAGSSAFPVALEIDPGQLRKDPIPALLRDGSTSETTLQDPRGAAWAPSGPLPLHVVSTIHFRSKSELEEHEARRYENVRPAETVGVDPDLFASDATAGVVEWLEQLAPVPIPTTDDCELADRISGALLLAAARLPTGREALVEFAALLDARVKRRKRTAESRGHLPEWLWLLAGSSRRGGSVDLRLFGACVDALAHMSRAEEWRPLELLDRIRAAVLQGRITKEERALLEKEVDVIASVLRNERDFPRFRHDTGHPVAKALFLVLMRPEPDRLLAWSDDETGADEVVTTTAAALTGVLRGRKSLDTQLRPEQLDRFLAAQEAVLLASTDSSVVPSGPAKVTVREEEDEDGLDVTVSSGGETLLSRRHAKPRDESAEAGDTRGSPLDTDVAVEVCRRMGWTDCIRTKVRVRSADFQYEASDNTAVFSFPGLVEPTFELRSAEFRRRLKDDGLAPEVKAELGERLAAAGYDV